MKLKQVKSKITSTGLLVLGGFYGLNLLGLGLPEFVGVIGWGLVVFGTILHLSR